jgi:hypothetical protein
MKRNYGRKIKVGGTRAERIGALDLRRLPSLATHPNSTAWDSREEVTERATPHGNDHFQFVFQCILPALLTALSCFHRPFV